MTKSLVSDCVLVGDLEQIIRSLYQEILGRDADTTGLNHYVQGFLAGKTIEELSQYISSSPEAVSRVIRPGATASRAFDGPPHLLPPAPYFDFAEEHASFFCRSIVANSLEPSPHNAALDSTLLSVRPNELKIFQYWDTTKVPNDVLALITDWKLSLPVGDHMLFDDALAAEFISDNYPSYFRAAYDYCFHPAMKSDYFRLAYLYLNGGVYIDADDKLIRNFSIPNLQEDDILVLLPIIRDRNGGAVLGLSLEPSRKAGLEVRYGPECYFANSPIFASKRNEVIRIALIRATNRILVCRRDGVECDIHKTTGPTNLTIAVIVACLYSACGGRPPPKILTLDWSQHALRQRPLEYKQDNRYWVNFQKNRGVGAAKAEEAK